MVMADEMDRLLEDVFDAVSAQQLALSELIVELVESGSLSRTGAANVVVRSEAFIQHLAERSLAAPPMSILLPASKPGLL